MGLAYLSDGRRMDYEEYLKTPDWRKKKADRLAFDNFSCGFCHDSLIGTDYETHHLSYSRLGHEDIETDLISLCHRCHKYFHETWAKQKSWEGHGSPISHWSEYSLEHTARICYENLSNDYFYGGHENMCNSDCVVKAINQYFKEHPEAEGSIISETDVVLYFRNKRYEIYLDSIKAGESLEELLDRLFGEKKKRGEGPNTERTAARSFLTKHKPASIKRFYNENSNILLLMNEVIVLERNNINEQT